MNQFEAKRDYHNMNNSTVCDNLVDYYTNLVKNKNWKFEDIPEFFQEKVLKELEKTDNTT